MHLDTATSDAPIARMQCPVLPPPPELEAEVVASFPSEYRFMATKAFQGLPDSDRDMAVMQIMSLRDHVQRMKAGFGAGVAAPENQLAYTRARRDLYWRTRIIALSDQVRGVGA